MKIYGVLLGTFIRRTTSPREREIENLRGKGGAVPKVFLNIGHFSMNKRLSDSSTETKDHSTVSRSSEVLL